MFGAAAVRQKKRLKEQQIAAGGGRAVRGPYIKPFGPRFDPNDLPYFKYKRAMLEAQLGSDSTLTKADQLGGEDGSNRTTSGANLVLYVGLGMLSVGLVITFVGLGDKGFRTLELKLIGPILVGCGLFFALLRILFCTIPACYKTCFKCCRKSEDIEELVVLDHPRRPGVLIHQAKVSKLQKDSFERPNNVNLNLDFSLNNEE